MKLNESNLHNYQVHCKHHIVENTHCGLFLDMGLGKTVSSLTAANYLMFEELEIDSILVIAPKRVAESVWSAECDKWEHLNHLKISKIIGNPKKRTQALKTKADIYIIGRDNIVWLCGQFGGSMLPFDMLIVDESSSFKSAKSLRFKALKKVQASFKRVVILTGTVAPNGLMDLWSQMFLLDRGERLGRTITEYRKNYFSPGQSNGQVVFNYNLNKGSDQLIHNKIKDVCMSMKAKDFLDLPERIDNYIKIDFPENIRSKYDEFEKEKILEILESDEEVSALNAASLSNKLLQFSNGAVYDEKKDYHEIHDLKLEALEELIEAANGKSVLVAYSYRHDLERIQKKLKKYNLVKLEKPEHIDMWNRGEIEVLLMHPASGGHGLNLQRGGDTIIWFGLNWSLELYMQLNARLHRQGQDRPVFIHHIVINNTMDIDVMKALERKDKKQESIMKAVKARLDRYKSYMNV